jgi:phenylalanyl-tRNA synthetase beta chain
MRVSLRWLRELVDCAPEALDPSLLAERLSVAGFEVEAIEDLAAGCAGVVVGRVIACGPHPDAGRLSVCRVAVGDGEPLQIVCGAPNVRQGIHVAVAPVGTHLAAVDLTIRPAELRGVTSHGMICSLEELGVAGPSEGIAVLEEMLDQVPPLGTAVASALDLDDQILELAITANRPDGLSMRGIAREVAALCGGNTRFGAAAPAVEAQPLEVPPATREAIEAGGLFSLTALRHVRVEPSPAWLRRRLERAGLRPVNNVVDVTNLVMLETGQPLHAFDRDALARLGGESQPQPQRVGLRQGRPGETLVTLDGEERELGEEALLVTYADRPIALAGVMGGRDEAVSGGTTAIWLEAAVFPSPAVRRSARSVGLRTEASSRFEKGVPVELTLAAADRAVELLAELTGAEVEGRWCHRRPVPAAAALSLRREALHRLLGPVVGEEGPMDLPDGRITTTLTALGCRLEPTEEGWRVEVPPSRRQDLRREVDLIEEVARLVGYDSFDARLPDPIEPGGIEPRHEAERRLRRGLCAAGLQETCALSLVPAAEGRLPLANPLLSDYGHLRDSLHEELLAAAQRNLQASQPAFWGYEIGNVFSAGAAGTAERTLLVGVMAGRRRSERWTSHGKPLPIAYAEARGVLQGALDQLVLPVEDRPLRDVADPPQLLHPGRAAEIVVEGRPVGWFGQLHPGRAEQFDLPEDTHLFQLDLAALVTAATRRSRWLPQFAPFPLVPASERDVAVETPRGTTAASLLGTIRKSGRPLLEAAELLDRYEGPPLGEGMCSQAFRLRYRDPRRTLTDEEVETAHGRVREALDQLEGSRLRS